MDDEFAGKIRIADIELVPISAQLHRFVHAWRPETPKTTTIGYDCANQAIFRFNRRPFAIRDVLPFSHSQLAVLRVDLTQARSNNGPQAFPDEL
jgi:hypothetical protein